MKELKALIENVTDNTLNGIIGDVIGIYGAHNNEMCEQLLLDEWEKRHPTQLPPALMPRVMMHGGMPASYADRTLTMDIDYEEEFPVS